MTGPSAEEVPSSAPSADRASSRVPRFEVRLTVDGRELSLKPFVRDMLGGAVVGLVSGLKHGENAGEVCLEVRSL